MIASTTQQWPGIPSVALNRLFPECLFLCSFCNPAFAQHSVGEHKHHKNSLACHEQQSTTSRYIGRKITEKLRLLERRGKKRPMATVAGNKGRPERAPGRMHRRPPKCPRPFWGEKWPSYWGNCANKRGTRGSWARGEARVYLEELDGLRRAGCDRSFRVEEARRGGVKAGRSWGEGRGIPSRGFHRNDRVPGLLI